MPEASVNFGAGVSNAWSNVADLRPEIRRLPADTDSRLPDRQGHRQDLVQGPDPRRLRPAGRARAASSVPWTGRPTTPPDILAKVVYYAIMLFVLSTAFGVFGSNPISDYLRAVIAYLPLVFVAIVIVVIAAAIAAGARNLIENSLGGLSYARVLANLASGFILAIGVIAALDQLHIAAAVVNAILYAVLAALVGIAIVAVGGGGIRTMAQRWEAVAARYDEEKPKIAGAVRSAPALPGQARQDAGDRERRTATAVPAPGTVARPYGERPEDRRY